MNLDNDVIQCTSFNHVQKFSSGRIHNDVLIEVVQDLDDRDIISIIFLMTDNVTDLSEVFNLIQKDSLSKIKGLSKRNGWEEKFLEILIIIGNIKVIKRLGFSENEIEGMKNHYVHNVHNVSKNLNRVIKSLYFLCENLNKKATRNLIIEVNKYLKTPLYINDSKIFLEIYILHWIEQKYITIDEGNSNLNSLINNLKNIDCLLDLPFNFDFAWKTTNQNQQDSSSRSFGNYKHFQELSNNPWSNKVDNFEVAWLSAHKRLCIIINQINFEDKGKFKTRHGSEIDEINLEKTFSGCNFEVTKYRNFTKKDMINFLNLLNGDDYINYGAIFLCILSHGLEGEIIFSDNQAISIKNIEEKMCCQKLQNVFKFIILQACQGPKIGFVEVNKNVAPKLVTDGLTCPIYRNHFGLFHATIPNFSAMRHQSEGSWFIQDICYELQNSTPIRVTEWIIRVTKRLTNRRSMSQDKSKNIVQVPVTDNTISVDYLLPQYCAKFLDQC